MRGFQGPVLLTALAHLATRETARHRSAEGQKGGNSEGSRQERVASGVHQATMHLVRNSQCTAWPPSHTLRSHTARHWACTTTQA